MGFAHFAITCSPHSLEAPSPEAPSPEAPSPEAPSPEMKLAVSVVTLGAVVAVSGAAVQLVKRFVGDGTWYNPGVGYGACGTVHQDSEFVVAVSDRRYEETAVDGNPNNNKICGRLISIDGESANGPVTAKIVDRCGGCKYDDIDMSPALFQHVVGDLGLGRRQINWHFI